MDQTFDLERYQSACKALLGKTLVIYATDADFTPAGKRRYRVVRHTLGKRAAAHIRWFVGQRAYRSLPLTKPNLDLSRDWQEAG
ncbi:hypothetical protein HHL24_27050 [Paraburkholderia sp. RP-4-7]|uniref:Uncharacterized protein n=1 Tax=Paraburkholderia polaris TaxID=2728848 RepID=A0A848IKD8_9BURK|nr:hypothetical protein [Paraburkholderia polaris]NMM01583.1 hypothetical protein [Paraburkholderia polaris]